MTYSSREVASKLGIAAPTLTKYLKNGTVPAPKSVTTGGITVYLWTEAEIEHVRKLLPKIANGRKTRYKKHSGVSKQQSGKAKPRKPKKK